MSKLELSARIDPKNSNIYVRVNGEYVGGLIVDRELAAEVLGILNHGAEAIEFVRQVGDKKVAVNARAAQLLAGYKDEVTA